MQQTAISRCEGFGYDQFTLSTLKALAVAFDVGLKVEFVPFSELVASSAYPSSYPLDVMSYSLEFGLLERVGNYIGEAEPVLRRATSADIFIEEMATAEDLYVSFQQGMNASD